tara:strand:- start:999 stop:1520 length:522 start_codon:yes stop_codon:yes gene_type:complete
VKKIKPWIFLCLLLSLFNSSCGILDPAPRTDGKFTDHYYSCGPVSIRDALTDFYAKNNIYVKRELTSKEISIRIQERYKIISLRGIMAVFDKRASQITFPKELIDELASHNIEVTEVNSLDDIDTISDTALVLVHKKGTILYYHWVCYPCETAQHYGKDTVIDKIYVLRLKSK